MVTVPFVDLLSQFDEIRSEVDSGLADILDRTAFIGGSNVADFEQAYADFVGVAHCIGVANGTDAIELALRAAGVGRDDEVILPANTFIATAEAVTRTGARPVLVDVDPDYLLIDPGQVRSRVSDRTKAIVPVHLFGQMAPVEAIEPIARECGAVVIEDAAQSQGATRFGRASGSAGTASGTSFYPGKNLGAAGDAGAVTTNDAGLARTVRLLGDHGSAVKYDHEIVGMNSRLDSMQAVVLRAKLARLTGWNQLRRIAADRYAHMLEALPGVIAPQTMPGNEHVWHLYVIQVEDRNRVQAELGKAGIGVGIHYPVPLHLSRAYQGIAAPGSFPVAEAAADRILSLPMFPHLSAAQQEQVVTSLASCLR
ncbi:MAG: DegT/DnrJ/EryC1/StrS family aminotransferase [Actinobacteria bacterium]|nr:DegT/DnrJ/EryC1/StrS family aminotransferase [Actinomycetota bacterium]